LDPAISTPISYDSRFVKDVHGFSI